MKYKDRLLEVTRHYLLKSHTSAEVDKMLGQWNDATYRDTRNKIIEDALAGIRDCVDKNNP